MYRRLADVCTCPAGKQATAYCIQMHGMCTLLKARSCIGIDKALQVKACCSNLYLFDCSRWPSCKWCAGVRMNALQGNILGCWSNLCCHSLKQEKRRVRQDKHLCFCKLSTLFSKSCPSSMAQGKGSFLRACSSCLMKLICWSCSAAFSMVARVGTRSGTAASLVRVSVRVVRTMA